MISRKMATDTLHIDFREEKIIQHFFVSPQNFLTNIQFWNQNTFSVKS